MGRQIGLATHRHTGTAVRVGLHRLRGFKALLAARPTAKKMIAHGWVPEPFLLLSVLTDAG